MKGGGGAVDLGEWLRCAAEDGVPDLYVIGFQELDLSKETFLLNNSNYEEMWRPPIEAALDPSAAYSRVGSRQLVGMLVLVYAREELLPHISEVATGAVGTGILGMMGNKGGVAVRLRLWDTAMCFVNSHLAAGESLVARRNQDYADITARMRLGEHGGVLDHDLVVWVGDLNYRLAEATRDGAIAALEAGEAGQLVRADQLAAARAAGAVFRGFCEGEVLFPPTYKYNTGTSDFDTKKMRTPGWCDRVLHRGRGVAVAEYASTPSLLISDHKPVRCLLRCTARTVDPVRRQSTLQEVLRTLDSMENDTLPDVTLSHREVHFADATFLGASPPRVLAITNPGPGLVEWSFLPKPGDASFCAPWLAVRPSAGLLGPGQVAEVEMSLLLDRHAGATLAAGARGLDDILVLHLARGKDYFVTVSVQGPRSFMCLPLAELVFLEQPVAQLSPGAPVHAPEQGRMPAAMTVPKEAWLMVQHLLPHLPTAPAALVDKGEPSDVREAVRRLDAGQPLEAEPPVPASAVADALMQWLAALPVAVVPAAQHARATEASASHDACRAVVNALDTPHQNIFLYITSLGRESLRLGGSAHLDTLALLLGGVLLRPPDAAAAGVEALQQQCAFVRHFLVNEDAA